jgi:hypothetical protein
MITKNKFYDTILKDLLDTTEILEVSKINMSKVATIRYPYNNDGELDVTAENWDVDYKNVSYAFKFSNDGGRALKKYLSKKYGIDNEAEISAIGKVFNHKLMCKVLDKLEIPYKPCEFDIYQYIQVMSLLNDVSFDDFYYNRQAEGRMNRQLVEAEAEQIRAQNRMEAQSIMARIQTDLYDDRFEW